MVPDYHDVTRVLGPGVVVYPGDIVPSVSIVTTDPYTLREIRLSTHSGTHVDAPSHYLPGALSIDLVDPGTLCGPAVVLDLSGRSGVIEPWELVPAARKGARLLIKTQFSGETVFSPDYRALSPESAALLADAGLSCVGTDTPSIEGIGSDGQVHRTLLSRGIPIIELLDLSGVRGGTYELIALPLRIGGADGAPARVLLREAEP